MFLSTVTLDHTRPTQTMATSEKIRLLAGSLKGNLSEKAINGFRLQLLKYVEEMEEDVIDTTFKVTNHLICSTLLVVLFYSLNVYSATGTG